MLVSLLATVRVKLDTDAPVASVEATIVMPLSARASHTTVCTSSDLSTTTIRLCPGASAAVGGKSLGAAAASTLMGGACSPAASAVRKIEPAPLAVSSIEALAADMPSPARTSE